MKLPYTLTFNHDLEWQMQKNHFHDTHEILFCLSNAGYCFVENQLFYLKRGTLLFIRSGILHRTIANTNSDYHRYVLHIPDITLEVLSSRQTQLFELFSRSSYCIHIPEKEIPLWIKRFGNCLKENSKDFGADVRKNVSIMQLVLETAEKFHVQDPVDYQSSNSLCQSSEIIQYIYENIQQELTLDQLSNTFFISKYHLSRLFKQDTGFTIREFIINNRILKAKTGLREGLSVQLAGEKAGFKNNAHFIRTFKNLCGISPGAYKKQVFQKNDLFN